MSRIKKAVAITDAKISFVSLVDKAANQRAFLIAKASATEKSFAMQGRILKTNEQTHFLTGIVYEPMVEDAHGNYMTEDEIVKASYWFAENGDKVDLQHNFKKCASCSVVENWVTKSAETIGNTKLAKGTWLITVKVTDPTIWNMVQKGEITGFSMGGVGRYSTANENLQKLIDEAVAKALAPILKANPALVKKQEDAHYLKGFF